MGSEGTVLGASSEVAKFVKSEQGEMLTKPFIDLCRLLFPIIDKLGPTLSAVKGDVGSNLKRLETIYSSDPLKYAYLQSIVQEEIQAKTFKKPSSCTNGLLWLTRAMDFFVELLKNVVEHPEWSMTHACTISYNKTLKRWHGWLTSSSFMVALQVVPERKKVIEILGGPDSDTEIQKFCAEFVPMLEENHKLLTSPVRVLSQLVLSGLSYLTVCPCSPCNKYSKLIVTRVVRGFMSFNPSKTGTSASMDEF